MKEIIFSILCVGGLLIPSAIFKQWWLFAVFMVFFICFGLIEWLAIKFSGMSVSQHVWQLKYTNPRNAYILCICMTISWASLIFHFLYHK
ncbi:MAG: hypothetical protein ACTSYZ_12600 [Candidatus Helarchaeota archaeon]